MEQQIALKESGVFRSRTQDNVANKLITSQTLTSGGRSYKEERPPLHVVLHPESPLRLRRRNNSLRQRETVPFASTQGIAHAEHCGHIRTHRKRPQIRKPCNHARSCTRYVRTTAATTGPSGQVLSTKCGGEFRPCGPVCSVVAVPGDRVSA